MPEKLNSFSQHQHVLSAEALVDAIRVELRREMSLFAFRGFFEPLVAVRLDDELLTLAAPSTFHRDWVRDHYVSQLEELASLTAGHRVKVTIIHDPRLELPEPPSPLAPPTRKPLAFKTPAFKTPAISKSNIAPSVPTKGRLAPEYTFDEFVIGPSNQMAFAAARAVAENPAEPGSKGPRQRYSPLFLFGGTGLGKTHLLHAIGNEAKRARPDLRVVTMSAEEWVNEYIHDIRNQRFDQFRKRYRGGCDLLLLDDVQFLAGKDASQDEFFHTFNSLYSAHRQIVVTADRYPHEIEGLEERLKTRLEWGLVADIQPPEIETRTAILQRKAVALEIDLGSDVIDYLAGEVRGSVRALEGALVRLSAFGQLTGCDIDLECARDQLKGVLKKGGSLTLDAIVKTVSSYYDLRPSDLKGKSRRRQIARARQISMYLARRHLSLSLVELGRAFSRDHTTVLASVRKIQDLVKTDAGIQAILTRLEKAL